MNHDFDRRELIRRALEQQPAAYAPYSGYQVAAAVLMDSGRIYTGAISADPYGRIEFSLDFSRGVFGTAESVRGFFGPDAVEPGAMVVDPDSYDYENLIVLSGDYADESGSYRYEAYLRPWGQLWDDAAAVSETLLPYFYESWYLPRIRANEPMPDRIGEGAVPRGAAQ